MVGITCNRHMHSSGRLRAVLANGYVTFSAFSVLLTSNLFASSYLPFNASSYNSQKYLSAQVQCHHAGLQSSCRSHSAFNEQICAIVWAACICQTNMRALPHLQWCASEQEVQEKCSRCKQRMLCKAVTATGLGFTTFWLVSC